MSLERKEIFEFGAFRLDVKEHTIERIDGSKNGTLPEKAFQALVLLVRRRGHLVSKDDLIRFVWPDTIVEDNNLEKCVHQIRHFLGETSTGSSYIETVRKHGYRFVGSIRTIEVSGTWLPESFRNFGDNGPDGLANDGLTAVEADTETKETVRKVRYAMGGAALSLIILGLIGGIAVFAYYGFGPLAMNGSGVDSPANRGTDNNEARGLYLQAMNLSEERGVEKVQKTLEYLDRTVALDPDYASAWAAKALTHRDMATFSGSDQHEQYQKSMEALTKALDIDPNLSEAYSALCFNKNRYEYDVAGAEIACKRAVELDPNSPIAHKTYANFLYSRGRFDEAIFEIKTAMDLQPVSYRNQQIYGLTLYYARRYGESEAQFKRLVELNPNHPYIHGRLVRIYEEQGKEAEAFEYFIKMRTLQNAEIEELENLRRAYEEGGWRAVRLEAIKAAEAAPETNHYWLACQYAMTGNKDQALTNLENAYQDRNFMIAVIEVEPQLDSLRKEPRYLELIKMIGFPPTS